VTAADPEKDVLAAEYVLGTLAPGERAQAQALIVIDTGFADGVRQWERRLGELSAMVDPVEPPSEMWDRIKAAVAASTIRAAEPEPLATREIANPTTEGASSLPRDAGSGSMADVSSPSAVPSLPPASTIADDGLSVTPEPGSGGQPGHRSRRP